MKRGESRISASEMSFVQVIFVCIKQDHKENTILKMNTS
jgi:hypothetical protein